MSVLDLVTSVHYLTDADGNRKAVQLDLAVWEELLVRLEELEEQVAAAETGSNREQLRAQVNESRQAYETGQARRGTVDDLMAEITD